MTRRDLNAGYPGGDVGLPPVSRWNEDGTCTYCGHTREEHGRDNCGAWRVASIFCRCPFGKGTK